MVPMPTYIYDMRAEERDEKNLPPFPEIGSNDDDGSYINQRLAWHIRRELSGTYSINYAAKKGVGGGAEADYVVNENSRGQIRFYGNGNDGLWGGITHRLFFGREVIQDKAGVFSFFALPQYKQYELETVLSHRERVNYQRVSFSPGLVLKRKQGEIIRKEAKYDAEFMLGQVNEENNLNLRRGGGAFSFYWDFPEVVVGKVTPSAALDARFYSNGQRWVKTMGGMDVRKALGKNISLGLGYLHYFGVDGQTPFNFEKHRYGPADYRFIAADRLTSDLYFVLGETGVKIETAYLLHTWQPEDIDYSLFFKLHCYNLMVKYRSLQREFEMGFSLAGG